MTGDAYTVVGMVDDVEHVVVKGVGFQEAIEVSVDNSFAFDSINIVEEYELIFRHDTVFVVADCDMLLYETKKMLQRESKMDEQVVILGNFVGPHEGFFEFMSFLVDYKRKKERYVVFVRGKNEHNLMEYIHQTKNYIGSEDDVLRLVQYIEDDLGYSLMLLEENHPEIYYILNDSLPYYENNQYILVSGGIDFSIPKWRETPTSGIHQASRQFIDSENNTGKTIVFGGVPVSDLNENKQVRPWINRGDKKIALNGNCRTDGKLLGALLVEDDTYFLSIRKNKEKMNYYDYY